MLKNRLFFEHWVKKVALVVSDGTFWNTNETTQVPWDVESECTEPLTQARSLEPLVRHHLLPFWGASFAWSPLSLHHPRLSEWLSGRLLIALWLQARPHRGEDLLPRWEPETSGHQVFWYPWLSVSPQSCHPASKAVPWACSTTFPGGHRLNRWEVWGRKEYMETYLKHRHDRKQSFFEEPLSSSSLGQSSSW